MSDMGTSPKPKKCLRAALYARVSSKQQAEANTIASQQEALQVRLQADGLRLEAELCFIDEGYSGGTLLRPALERLRDQAAAGAFDRLYVHSPDRLARHYPYQVLLVEELQRYGIEIVFLNHDIGRSPEDNLLLQVQGMMAEYERAKILERSRRGKRHAARAGVVNVLSGAPYGYRYVGKYEGNGQARYEVNEVQAEVVRQIFRWVALERCSIGEVCRRLRGPRRPQSARQGLLGSHDGVGHSAASGLCGSGPVWQDACRTTTSSSASSARQAGAAATLQFGLRHSCRRADCDRGAGPGGRGDLCRRGRAVDGESQAAA